MRHFLNLAAGLDVIPIVHALQLHPELWNADPLRTTFPGTPHGAASDILIRFNDASHYRKEGDVASIVDGHESVWHPAARRLPAVRSFCFWLMQRVEGERLGRVIVTRLPPGKRIEPHRDTGAHAAYYERYHLALQCLPGVVFVCGEETVQMRAGDVWWFNNDVEHYVENNSADDRLTLIVDIHVDKGAP